MDEILKQIFGSEVLTDETKGAISEAFKKVLIEAKAEQEKAIRAEYAERYERDKLRIAEAVEQFVESHCEKELTEMRDSIKSLQEMKLKYAEATVALKDRAKEFVQEKMSILTQAVERALRREVGELHEELQDNRRVVLQKIAEVEAKGAAEREIFRKKAGKVLEHIVKVKMEKHFAELAEDIRVAKENDFGRRVFESVYAECRRLFFNSSAELKNLTGRIAEQEANHKKALQAAQMQARKAVEEATLAKKQAAKLHESAQRGAKMNKLLSVVPAGAPREKMKLILESTPSARLDDTFKKYVNQILTESRQNASPKASRIQQVATELRTGNANNVLTESVHAEDDEEIIELRRRIGK